MEVLPTGASETTTKGDDEWGWARRLAHDATTAVLPLYRGSPYSLRSTPARQLSQSMAAQVSEFDVDGDAEPLGVGGYATVMRARHRTSGEAVAAKVVSLDKASLVAVRAEVALLCRLVHQGVVRVCGFEEDAANGRAVIYMELCASDLFARVRRDGQLAEPEAIAYFGQMMAAVAHLHAHGVVHRDLKLENVLLDSEGHCRLADFGLAHQYKSHDTADARWLHDIYGSKSYCAPEVLQGNGYDGYPADVWSCGVCLFAMLAGFFPLDEATPADWRFERLQLAFASHNSLTLTIYGFYQRTCELSPDAIDTIDAMLELRPQARPTAADVASAPWLRGESVAESSVGPRYRHFHSLSHGTLAAALAAPVEQHLQQQPTMPIYRSGSGGQKNAVPPELARQKPRARPAGDWWEAIGLLRAPESSCVCS